MICHHHKIIFIHIPKCAGSSIKNFYFNGKNLDWKKPNYDTLYGYCPKRQIHMQHATAKELVEMGLVTEQQWKTYYKFTFVRNVFDRTYSDYLWIQKDQGISGSFEDYLYRTGAFKETLTDKSSMFYRGDHLTPQTNFFDFEGFYRLDFVGRFESFNDDIGFVNRRLRITENFSFHEKQNKKRFNHYSRFYDEDRRKMVEEVFRADLNLLNYSFEQKETSFNSLRRLFSSSVSKVLSDR